MKFKVFLFIAVLILLLAGVAWWNGCFNSEVEKPPPDTRPQIPVVEKPSVNRNEQSLPPEVKPANVKGRLRVTVKDPTTGNVTTVDVLVPADDSSPTILVDTTTFGPFTATAEYTPFRDPWVVLEPHLFIGGSASRSGVSPFAGVSLVTLTRFNVRAGLGADLWGGGVFIGWEFFREFNLHGQYSILKWDDKATTRASVGISYRL